jgi:hypothetical protein
MNPVRNSNGALNPAAEQQGIISNGVNIFFLHLGHKWRGFLTGEKRGKKKKLPLEPRSGEDPLAILLLHLAIEKIPPLPPLLKGGWED